ncbi:hypothetical protein V8F06_006484 [Rhypophila decipiens]
MAEPRFPPPAYRPDESVWLSSELVDKHTIISVKQQALDAALDFTENIAQEIAEHGALASNEISQLLEEAAKLRQTARNFKVLVGVRGATGAGKSSLFNSLLGMPILPVSSTQASTATVCHISWNHDDDPQRAFRAQVFFTGARLEELDTLIKEGLAKWGKVWKLDEKTNGYGSTAKAIISRNGDIAKLLDTTMEISASGAKQFAQKIKPYVDTSQTPDHTIVWPLVKEVRVFVKSDILRYNIDLVDLPGCSDRVSSRSKIAENYARNLDFSIIVLPAERAVDENVGVGLMTEYQKMEMKLAGNLHKNIFCVVVSKIDGLGDDYRKSPEVLEDEKIREYEISLTELKAQLKNIKHGLEMWKKQKGLLDTKLIEEREIQAKIREEEKKTKSAMKKSIIEALEQELAGLRRQYKKDFRIRNEVQRTIDSLKDKKPRIQEEQARIIGEIRRRCVWIRNEYIKKKIQADLSWRRDTLKSNSNKISHYNGEVDILPINAREYQYRLAGKEVQDQAFPSKLHTGIPRVRQWIEECAYEQREKHIDSLLASFQRIQHDMNQWCDEGSSGGTTEFARPQVLGILKSTTNDYLKKTSEILMVLIFDIKNLLPVANRKKGLNLCASVGGSEAEKWVKKYPDNQERSHENMAWNTYLAIMMRHGVFTSSAKVTYDWPATLTVAFLNMISKEWMGVFDHKIPALAEECCGKIELIWTEFLLDLQEHIISTSPSLQGPFAETVKELAGIAREFWVELDNAITAACKSAQRVHGVCDISIREDLNAIFDEAIMQKVGTNIFGTWQRVVTAGVRDKCLTMFEGAYDKMENARVEGTKTLWASFEEISTSKFRAAMNKVVILLNKLDATSTSYPTTLAERTELQAKVRASLLLWENRWRKLGHITEAIPVEKCEIPEEYCEEPPIDDQEMSDADSSDEEADADADTDSD